MSKKTIYESPKTECLVIRFEANIMSGQVQASGDSQFSDENADITDGSSSIFW